MGERDIIQSFWYGNKLSPLEQLCIRSFLHHGHPFHLYTYGNVEGVPEATVLQDANEIIKESEIFFYGPEAGVGQGSVAVFANLFRYKLLASKGNWWVDTDVICLKPFEFPQDFVVGRSYGGTLTNGVMKSPQGSPLMLFMSEFAERPFTKALPWESPKSKIIRFLQGLKRQFRPGCVMWGTTGPIGLNRAIEHFKPDGYWAPHTTFHPLKWDKAIQLFQSSEKWKLDDLAGSYGVHLCNEVLRREGIDKFSPFPPDSVVSQLMSQYGASS